MTDAPLLAEPILGWRLWHVRRGELLSWSQSAAWPARSRLEATCRHLLRGCDGAPRSGHDCGIYALRTRQAAESLFRSVPRLRGAAAIGQVSLWGRVIENVGGWRAQFAYPYDLVLLGGDDATAAELRRCYLVDVRREV